MTQDLWVEEWMKADKASKEIGIAIVMETDTHDEAHIDSSYP
jgi:hypothetical protein